MAQKSQDSNNTKNKSRQRPALALLLVVLLAAAFFMMSDVSFVKSARDSLMQKFGYEAIEQENSNENGSGNDSSEDGSESSGVKTAEWDITADIDGGSGGQLMTEFADFSYFACFDINQAEHLITVDGITVGGDGFAVG